MNDVPIPSDDGGALFKEVLGYSGAPAYVRRARRVEDVFDQLVGQCRRQRDEWLALVRVRLGVVRALAGSWEALGPFLADGEGLRRLQEMHAELEPRLRAPVEPTTSARALRLALDELRDSVERFNRRWLDFVRAVDLTRVNDERADYNRWFLLEKECAVRLPHVARAGYRPLDPLTADELLALLPPLPVPRPAP